MVDAEVGKLGVLARNRLYLGGKANSLSTNLRVSLMLLIGEALPISLCRTSL